MRERDEKRGGGCAAFFSVAAVLAMLTLLYVLSTGPAFILLPRKIFEIVYFPVLVVHASVPPFRSALDWYMRFWVAA